MTIREDIGLGFGKILSAATYLGSALREARIFHPEGELVRCEAEVESQDPAVERFARDLSGPALIRFSGGIWKDQASHFDILGVALRLGWKEDKPLAEKHVQDLVMGTFKSLLTLPLAPLSTNTRDYLANNYYSVTPYKADGLGKLEFRLVGESQGGEAEEDRAKNLAAALESGGVPPRMHLEIRREAWMAKWEPFLRIELKEFVNLSDEKFFFSPFHDGKNIHPVGFINFIRKKTYAASRAGRVH